MVTRRANKNLLLLFIAIVVFLTFVYAGDIGIIRDNIIQKLNTDSQLDNYCENNIFVDQIKIYKPYQEAYEQSPLANPTVVHTLLVSDVSKEYPRYYGVTPSWKDGIEMRSEMAINGINTYSICHKGQTSGENINSLYCQNLEYSKETQNLAEDGVIEGYEKRNYLISMEINYIPIKEEKIYRRAYLPGPENKQVIAGILSTHDILSSDCKRVRPYE